MATTRRIEVKGLKEIDAVLRRLPAKVTEKVIVDGLKAGGRVIADDMRRRVPVDTGALKRAITVRKATRRQLRQGTGTVVAGFRPPRSRIAHLVEFGTSRTAAQPFIRPALETKANEAIRVIGAAFGRAIEKAAADLAGTFSRNRRIPGARGRRR